MPPLKRSLQLAKANHHRMLLLLAGNNDLERLSTSKPLSEHDSRDASDQINTLLGSETNSLIFDAIHAFDERLFAASAGTLRAGGILVLLTPPLSDWSSLHSAHSDTESLFIKRLIRKIQQHSTTELENLAEPNSLSELIQIKQLNADTQFLLIADTEPSPALEHELETAWQSEQKRLIEIVVAQLNEPTASTIVVQANRGRGKSALIGLALNQYLDQQHNNAQHITVTSNRRSACDVLLQHAQMNSNGVNDIRFLPIDQAITMQHGLLIVEEAGSISLPILSRLTHLSENIVFATTVQGYEGAGRGFALRFSKYLDNIRPDWVKLEPIEPIRWANNDPVEAFVNDALLLESQLAALPNAQSLCSEQTQLQLIDRGKLCTNDPLLEAIYSLLVQAHYQTTPADLRNLLDEAKIQIFVQRSGDVVTGAALIALEGEIPADLHQAIVNKQRRLADQILPQLLAQSAPSAAVLDKRYARVIRIAIHPELHRQGFGTQLLNQLHQQIDTQVDVVGASFGADDQTLAFWLKQGYQAIHYGYKANARSGLRSACMLKVTSNNAVDASEAIQRASSILNHNLSAAAQYNHEPSSVMTQLSNASYQNTTELTNIMPAALLQDFCLAKRSFFDTCGFIQDALRSTANLSESNLFDHMQLLLDESTLAKPKEKRAAEQALRSHLSKAL